jgi:hypothetical protein
VLRNIWILWTAAAQGAEAKGDDETESGVQIMTIHAAKGLEFPVVILPELADPISARPGSVQTDGSDWIACNKSLSVNDQSDTLFLPSWLAEQQLLRSAAEERRVLYVAMTRCQDELYLTATRGETAPVNSFFGWIEPLLPDLPINTRIVSAHSLETAGAAENEFSGWQPNDEKEVQVRRFYDQLNHGTSLAGIRHTTGVVPAHGSAVHSEIPAELKALAQPDFLDMSQSGAGTSADADGSEVAPAVDYYEGRAIVGATLEAPPLTVSWDDWAQLADKLWLMPEQLRFLQWAAERVRERGSLAAGVARFFEEGSLPGTEVVSGMLSGPVAAVPDREVRLDEVRCALFLAWGADSALAAHTGARVWLKTMVESGLTGEAFVYNMHDGSLTSMTSHTDSEANNTVPEGVLKRGSRVFPGSFLRDQIRGLLGSTKGAS